MRLVTNTTTHMAAGILVIDADPVGARLVVDVLAGAGYQGVRHSADCEGLLSESPAPMEVDLVVLDLRLQEAEGVALLEVTRQKNSPDGFLPVVAIGPPADPRLGLRALRAGASDYVDWPLDADDFLARVGVQLEIRSLCRRLLESKLDVEDLLRRRTREAQESHLELLERLARVAELRDDPSGGHPGRVGRLAGLIAQELMLPAEETRCLLRAAPLQRGHPR
jgi:response regulator RpfG family c-di-GMP phosphodiesterase